MVAAVPAIAPYARAIKAGLLVLLVTYLATLPDPTYTLAVSSVPATAYLDGMARMVVAIATGLAACALVWGSQVAAHRLAARIAG